MSNGFNHRYIISVLTPDRVGILRDISSTITGLKGNIDGISLTVVVDYFTVVLTSSFRKEYDAAEIRAGILKHFHDSQASVTVKPYKPAAAPNASAVKSSRYIVTIAGKDHIGLLQKLTSFLASRKINIDDWYVEFRGENVTHIGEVSVPAKLDIKKLQTDLSATMGRMGIMCSLQHENIFRATNEIGAVSYMLGDQNND
jgi:predicted amino acid-binding ACT domain protein